jgi:hypothetical protein
LKVSHAGGNRYVVLALLGKIKGKSGDRAHLIPWVPETSSGIDVRMSVSRLIDLKRSQGHTSGPAISDVRGKVFSHRVLNNAMLEILKDLFHSHCELFLASIWVKKL